MSQDQYNVSNITNQNGNIVIGKNNTVTNSTVQSSELKDATARLIEEIDKLNLSSEQKSEIKNIVQDVTEEASAEKPNKTKMSIMLDGLNKMIETVGKVTILTTAYEAWKKYVLPLI